MSLRPQLEAVATLLDEGAAESAVRMLRGAWEPELPATERIPLYCLWIRALVELDELEQAARLAERATEEFPANADVLIAAGNVHDVRGDLAAARTAFEAAAVAEPAGALQHYNLGAVLERLGHEEEAIEAYRQALERGEELWSSFEATAALGALLRRGGRLEEAVAVYEAYLEEDPINVELLVEHGICLSDLDAWDEAIDRFELALSLDPDHAGGLYNLAITFYRKGDPARALERMELAHRAEPDNALTHAVLGAWRLVAGVGLDEALQLLYRALDRLEELKHRGQLGPAYAALVVEEVFEALWQSGRRAEAREVARWAGRRDCVTETMLETLNAADHGREGEVTAYTVSARAEAGAVTDPAPEHWPADAGGFTADLTVLASDEAQARELALQYLCGLEPGARFDVNVVGQDRAHDSGTVFGRSPAPGVVRVNAGRAYFRTE